MSENSLKYNLYIINKQINKLTIQYNNWENTSAWCEKAIEVNPKHYQLESCKKYREDIFKKYKILQEKYPKLPHTLHPESKLSLAILKLFNFSLVTKPTANEKENIIQTI